MNKRSAFTPEWPRIFLDSRLAQVFDRVPDQGRCLNLGCGTEGRYEALFAGLDTDGVDIADSGGRSMPWRYHRCDARALPFADESFDVAVAIESFEHIEDNVSAAREMVRTLKPGGLAVITTPTHWTWPFEFGRHGPHYYNRKTLRELMQTAGLRVDQEIACGGLVFYGATLVKSWLSPVGVRLLGKRWWRIVDGALRPFYAAAYGFDRAFSFPPSNWIMVGQKPPKS